MHQDLQDLIAAWLRNADLSPARRDELLARLRSDSNFRREFVEEIQMHGYVRAAQSSEPRWPLLEEAMGGHEDAPGLEDSIMARLAQMPTPTRRRTWSPWWAMVGFGAAALAVLVAVRQMDDPAKAGSPPVSVVGGAVIQSPAVAVLSHVVEAAWADGEPERQEGAELSAGWLRLALGTVQIDLFSGARLFVEGPAQLELRSSGEAFLLTGKIACELGDQARGFRLLTPGLTVVNQGNSFGVKVSESGEQEVHALEGKVVIGRTGELETSQLAAKQARRLDDAGFSETQFRPEDFPAMERVREREQAEAARLLLAWRAAADALDNDPSLCVHFNFEDQSPLDATLRNRVRGDRAGTDGQIIGARWSQGRWPGKGALEFRGRGQRVLLRLPGVHASMTLLAWVRVDALPQAITSLLATEEPQRWDPDEQKKASEPSSLHAASGRPLRWELKSNGQLGISLLRGIVSGKPLWDAHLAPPLLTPERHGQWVFLATVHDAPRSELTHFINGAPIAHHKLAHDTAVNLTHLSLGNLSVTDAEARQGMSYGFFGALDELVVASRPFSAAELRRYYEVGRP